MPEAAPTSMHLKVLLPFRVFADRPGVQRIVAETPQGAMGFWPRRLDCVAAPVQGILTYESPGEGEVFVAVDSGVLVKIGAEVRVSVRRAIAGNDLAQLPVVSASTRPVCGRASWPAAPGSVPGWTALPTQQATP